MNSKRRLRIALISEHASPLADAGSIDAGGQNVYVAHVAQGLAAAGHQVDVMTRRDSPALPAMVELHSGVRVHHIDAGPPRFVAKEDLLDHMPEFTMSARRLLDTRPRFDVLHANFFMSGCVGLALAKRFRVPLVTTFHALGLVRRQHQGASDAFPPERIDIERALVRDSDRVIAECPQDEADLRVLYGAPARRIRRVPCGVDTEAFRPGDRAEARARLGLSPKAFIALQLGRMVPRKGIDNVIEAIARLPANMPAELVVVGGDSVEPDEATTPEIGRLRRLAEQLGVAAKVRFVGRRERSALRDWYVAADVFVTTPWYEPFGITPLEAMACGTPVIGAAVGGIAHTVVDGVTGLHVPPRDPAALAAAMKRLYDEPLLGVAYGLAGLRRVRSRFTWQHVSEQLAEVYGELARQRRLEQRWPVSAQPAGLWS